MLSPAANPGSWPHSLDGFSFPEQAGNFPREGEESLSGWTTLSLDGVVPGHGQHVHMDQPADRDWHCNGAGGGSGEQGGSWHLPVHPRAANWMQQRCSSCSPSTVRVQLPKRAPFPAAGSPAARYPSGPIKSKRPCTCGHTPVPTHARACSRVTATPTRPRPCRVTAAGNAPGPPLAPPGKAAGPPRTPPASQLISISSSPPAPARFLKALWGVLVRTVSPTRRS